MNVHAPAKTVLAKPATYADLEAVAPHLVAEILFGRLVTHPRPRFRHGSAAASLAHELIGPFQKGVDGPGGWLFAHEPELHLDVDGERHVVVPDVAGWRVERCTFDFDVVGISVAPDWICEVLSPSTEKFDRGPKRLIYAGAGVRDYWLLDPRLEMLETFELVGGKWQVGPTFEADQAVAASPFAAVPFGLAGLWPVHRHGQG
jgi:hypothetical protein